MNASSFDSASVRIRIDQLVANELCEKSRAELIQWLEESREGWRDLGLAFLESQVWTSSLAELESRTPVATAIDVPESGRKEQSMKQLGMRLALAASLLLTFFAGVKWAEHHSNSNGDNSRLAHTTDNVSNRSEAVVKDKQTAAAREDSADQAPIQAMEISAYGKNASGTLEKIKMPMNAVMSASRSNKASESVKRALEDRGFAVRTEQRFLPATLSDGTEVMLPFDQLKANYVGKAVY